MILPIFAFGQPVLKQVAQPITPTYPDLEELIANMWETMYHAEGVGLAAPQIGLAIRLFVIDSTPVFKEGSEQKGFKKVFINAQVLEEHGELWEYEEGCLSIPNIRGSVSRPETVRLRYQDEQFVEHVEEFSGFNARVIQHEYDHIEGILFTDLLKPLKKRLIQKKLNAIAVGNADVDYKMKFNRAGKR
jgi:peptide deformylase